MNGHLRGSSALGRVVVVALVVLCLWCSSPVAAGIFGGGDDTSKVVTKGTTDEQINFWQREVSQLRVKEITPAMSKLYSAQAALAQAKKKEGFFYTDPKDKATIRSLDEDYRRSLVEVETLRQQEKLMLAKLKPLYGIVSTQFAQEQKNHIAATISTVQEMSYNNAWYSSLFRVGEAESLTDIIVGFLVEWLVGYVIMYPFAVLYYAVFVAPWSVYEYTSGFSDFIPAVVAYILSVGVMCLPLLALAGGLYYVVRVYGSQMREAMRQAEMRGRHYHTD